jgi:hypothetical protein
MWCVVLLKFCLLIFNIDFRTFFHLKIEKKKHGNCVWLRKLNTDTECESSVEASSKTKLCERGFNNLESFREFQKGFLSSRCTILPQIIRFFECLHRLKNLNFETPAILRKKAN